MPMGIVTKPSPRAPGRPRRWRPVRSPGRAAELPCGTRVASGATLDRKSTRLNSSHVSISYAVFCLKKKKVADPGNRFQFATVTLVFARQNHSNAEHALTTLASYARHLLAVHLETHANLCRPLLCSH